MISFQEAMYGSVLEVLRKVSCVAGLTDAYWIKYCICLCFPCFGKFSFLFLPFFLLLRCSSHFN